MPSKIPSQRLSGNLPPQQSERQFVATTENERQLLGRELHDTLGQQCTAIGMMVAALKDALIDDYQLTDEAMLKRLDNLQSHIGVAQQQIRALMLGLSPVDVNGGGLPSALARLAKETTEVYGVACRVECDDDVLLRNSFIATQLFLIVREATHNAAKHARAKEIVIRRLVEQDGVRFTVSDDGVGVPTEFGHSAGLGLRIMRHRAYLIRADFQLESLSAGGTRINCFLPTSNTK